FIEGSLATIQRALEEVGLRSVLCYEVTDRNGPEGREAGLRENRAFADQRSELTRSLIGAHASFTLSDDAMAGLFEASQATGRAVHIHVAEDVADVEDCRARYGLSGPERDLRYGPLPRGAPAAAAH